MTIINKIHGRKGGSSSASAPRVPVEQPNTLRSKATARILDALGEGEIVGLVDGAKSIYLDNTPLQNIDGSYNFHGVTWEQRTGTPDQEWIRGFPAVETPVGVGVTVKYGPTFAVTRRIDNLDATAVRVTVAVPSMFTQDQTSGDTNGSSVSFIVRIRRVTPTAGWEEYPQTISGKTMSAYQESYRLPLNGDGPWDVQVERFTPDSDKATVQNGLTFDSFTELVELPLTYPRTALVGVAVDGELFGSNIPSRAYDVKGWIVRVPNIYDGENRVYTSDFWDGTFKRQWTDDPAWLFYHLLTHPAGAGLSDNQIDKWSLFEISRYCSERVDDGYGGKEPRFSANFVINSRTEAYGVINALASAFRGMTFWHSGAVSVVADMPADADVIVSQANTSNGFEYSGASLKSRHTVALVSYLDAENSYETSIETVEDADGIEKYGWNPVEINAFACTSRGQAHRLGRWTLDTERYESEALTYKASVDHLNVVPGMVAAIADPEYASVRSGGRVAAATTTNVTLDAAFQIEAGHSYKLMATMPNATIETRTIVLGPGTYTSVPVSPAFSAAPIVESNWIITSTALAPRLFKVMGISEDDDVEFTISAIYHDPTKFARVEQGIQLERPPFTRLPNPGIISPPSNVAVSREYISTPSGFTDALQVTWTASTDPYVRGYIVKYQKNLANWQIMPEVSTTSYTLYGEGPGSYIFQVFAVNFAGVQSLPATLSVNISNESPITLLKVTGLELEGQGNNQIFQGRDPVFAWRATAIRGAYALGEEPSAGAGYLDNIFRDFEVRVYDVTNNLFFTDHTQETRYIFSFEKNAQTTNGPHRKFRFQVLMRDKWGNYSLPADLAVENPAPAQPTNLSVQAGYASIFVSFDRPTDLDFEGSLIWVSDTTGFVPGPENLAYDGPDTYKYLVAPERTTRYVRVAAYDSFGKTELNVTAELSVIIGGVVAPDSVPPTVPTGLVLTSDVVVAADGTATYRLHATWDANPEGDFLSYGLSIRQAGGNAVFFTTDQPSYEWIVDAGVTYYVSVRATDYTSNSSVYSGEISHTVLGDNSPPALPSGLAVKETFKSLWLNWDKHPASDFSHMEVWEAASANRAQASMVAIAPGTTFIRENLDGGTSRWYWLQAVDRSGNKSGFFPVSTTAGVSGRTKKVEEADFQELTIGRGILKEASVDSANIVELDASKIKAGSILSGTILVDGRQIGSIVESTGDPAALINTGSTLIDPGKILISGATKLSDWKSGGDRTTINGGVIEANTIKANSLSIGNRNILFSGVAIEPSKETNIVSWTSGIVVWQDDTGATRAESVSAQSAQFSGLALYLGWYPGAGTLFTTTDINVYSNPNIVVVGQYFGGVNLFVDYGRTVIDGTTIRSRTISALQIQANTISANELSAGTLITRQAQIQDGLISRAHIGQGQIDDGHINNLSAGKITSGTINSQFLQIGTLGSGFGNIQIESRFGNRRIVYVDGNNTPRVAIGQFSTTPNLDLDGLYVWNKAGQEVITANGLATNIVGTLNINGEAVTTGKIQSGATSAMSFVRTWQMNFISAAGGNIHIQSSGTIISPSTFTVRVVGNGIELGKMFGVVGAFHVMAVHAPPIGSLTTYKMQYSSNNGINWNDFIADGNFVATMVAVEYKR